jgi:aarF domain-containing kinase
VLVAVRLVRHVLVFAPLVLLYLPCRLAGTSVHDLWWSWAIFALEASGPALVKLGQWAATRSDMFPSELCRRLAQLHANARTHRLALSAGELQELLRAGDYVLVSIDEEPIGSGCIAQVHRAIIAPRTQQEQQQRRTVAVKAQILKKFSVYFIRETCEGADF